MNLREVRKLVPYWQEILNIKEWKITVRWGRKKELPGEVGLNIWSVEELESDILLARNQPAVEETLVHELIHLVVDGHKDPSLEEAYDPLHERAINRLAKALMKARDGIKEVTNGAS